MLDYVNTVVLTRRISVDVLTFKKSSKTTKIQQALLFLCTLTS